MNLSHPENMKLALDLARAAEAMDEVPIGAVLMHEGKIIGQGYNVREKTGRTTAHAEIQALEDYNQRTKEWRLPPGSSLYVTAEPCLMCTGALIWARLDGLFYGAFDSKNASLRNFLPMIEQGLLDHRFKTVEGGISKELCGSILSQYFKKKRS
ncbi:MAG: nucleoside deaminase [Pseudomonadota bacterium]